MNYQETKKIRIILGMLMFHGFFAFAFTLHFTLTLPFENTTWSILAFLFFWFAWMPAVILIIQNYYLLTKVFKYKEIETSSEIEVKIF